MKLYKKIIALAMVTVLVCTECVVGTFANATPSEATKKVITISTNSEMEQIEESFEFDEEDKENDVHYGNYAEEPEEDSKENYENNYEETISEDDGSGAYSSDDDIIEQNDNDENNENVLANNDTDIDDENDGDTSSNDTSDNQLNDDEEENNDENTNNNQLSTSHDEDNQLNNNENEGSLIISTDSEATSEDSKAIIENETENEIEEEKNETEEDINVATLSDLDFDVVEDIATQSEINEDGLFGTAPTYWVYYYIDDSDADNITIHYTGTAPADWDSIPTNKRGGTNAVSAPNVNSNYKTTIKTAIFDDEVVARTCYNWFSGFTNLTTITNISNLNLTNAASMDYMFKNCTSLQSVVFSTSSATSVTSTQNMFEGCASLTTVDIGSLTFAALTNASNMFKGCTALTNVNINSLFPTSVININASNMFKDCTSLQTVNLANVNMSTVKNMSYMFDGCTSLTSLDFSSSNVGAVTSISYMFRNCSSLTSLNMSNFNAVNVTNKLYAFDGCTAIRNLNLSASMASIINDMKLVGNWKKSTSDTIYEYGTSKTTIPAEAAEYIRAFKVTFNANDGNAIAPAFKEYNGTVTLTTPARPGFTFDGWFTDSDLTNAATSPYTVLGDATIYAKWSGGEGATLVYWGIGEAYNSSTFGRYRYLYLSMNEVSAYNTECRGSFVNTADFNSEADVPWHSYRGDIGYISVYSNFNCKSMAYWFKDMVKLKNSSLTMLTTRNQLLENISHMFEGCTNLKNVNTILITNNFKNMDSAFKNCSNINMLILIKEVVYRLIE